MLDHISVKYFKMAVNSSKYNESDNDLSCRCPVCGDSKHSMNSRRLHLYRKNNLELVNCFNGGCPVQNKTVYSFLRDFYPDLLPRYKKETFRSKIENIAEERTLGSVISDQPAQSNNVKEKFMNNWEESFNSDIKQETISDNIEWSTNQDSFCSDWEKSEIAEISDRSINNRVEIPPSLELYNLEIFFKPLTDQHKQYLNNRKISALDYFKVGKDNIMIPNSSNPKESTFYYIKDYLVIPLYIPGTKSVYGFYSRDIRTKKFITFVSTTGYKVWNWFNIDKSKPVYIFEGIFDALSSGLENVIANLGAKIPQQRIDELKEPVFCLDNDRTGILESIRQVNSGYSVYVQPREYLEKDLNEIKLNHPTLDISNMVESNIFTGISGVTRLKTRL